ncbi:hypothetical protein GXW83_02855 [Streptacidiphilus sp. PB12-B1b]|uniref:polymorphic toxin-type HINT domain-containing protein n=1 Tax=Streptacidiphilus sp. PB12-B1b TaxID=2705012 RepID=UPI0015FC2352|nr:polymorphic toxin-type HINT domain-containing protein [Streptacidiphilus sp. PB12-B1b]QMU74868.1 hypothetical protein GXW83_02855 [Streptacidiphilus sp. PB12-B1b]
MLATVGVLGFACLAPTGTAAAQSAVHYGAPAVHKDKTIPFTLERPRSAPAPKDPAQFNPSGHTAFPAAGSASVVLGSAVTSKSTAAAGSAAVVAGAARQAGKLPVWLTPLKPSAVEQVKVTVASQATTTALGVHGLLMSLQAQGAGGKTQVRVDPSSFEFAYGGDYASRLRLVELPTCALTTPSLPACQKQTPLMTTAPGQLSAQVTLPAAIAPSGRSADGTRSAAVPSPSASSMLVIAADSGVSGSSGTYSATSLSPGGTWSESGNTGGFTYSYPIQTPPAVGGLAPQVGLSYDSSSQDARTEGTNDQSSWVGDGWDSMNNYIERTYEACSDDSSTNAPTGDGDECWAGQQLTLSLNGTSTPIVDDNGTFRLAQDSATTKVQMLTGASNGTADGEYFEVTENGVQYYFGMNHLPGWASKDTATQSAWNLPVYQAHAGVSACPSSSTFASTSCVLPWRLNLDYVVDTHGNAMAYYYVPETNYYGADLANTAVAYTRGGTLSRIDYGMTSSTIYSATAPEQVLFTTAQRCTPGSPAPANTCSDAQFTPANASYWPDVPIDLSCASDSSCTNHGPSFWSREMLTTITTQIQFGGSTHQVDKYSLSQSFLNNGDNAPTPWLGSITHTGQDTLGGATTNLSTPSVSFTPDQLANRVGTIPDMPSMYHNRIGTIDNETGAQTTVTYNTPNCSSAPASNPKDPTDAAAQGFASTNTLSCFPVYWTPTGQPAPMMDWFYLHTVKSVTTNDTHNTYADGSYPEETTSYNYLTPAWHYDDNPVVKAKYRTWGQFRGYAEVDTTTGDPTVFHKTNGQEVYDQQTLTKAYYFQGMNGDTLPGGKLRSVPALTSQDGSISVADADPLAGQLFETDTYTNATSRVVNKTVVTVPTIIGPTASQSLTGLPDLTATMVRTAKTVTRQAVSYGWRTTETDAFFNTTLGQNTTGMTLQVDDRGEVAATGNATNCTFTSYLTNSALGLALPAEVVTTDQDCNAAGATPSGNLISDTRTSYDSKNFTTDASCGSTCVAPTIGDPTEVQKAAASSGASATAFVTESTTAYDSYGRTVSVTRTPASTAPNKTSLAQTTQTLYSPASGAPPTTVMTETQVTPGTACATLTTTSTSTAACEVTSDTMDPARAKPVAEVSAAGLKTTLAYDELGRLTSVWEPNESQSAGASPNLTYNYTVSQTGPNVTATNTLLDSGSYSTSESLYDALMSPIQTQATSENGTTVVSDTEYDSHGWAVSTDNSYDVSGNPSTSLVSVSGLSIPDTTVTDHDGLGRATQVTEEHDAAATWTTRTVYTGDTTTVLPTVPYVGGALSTTQPPGAVATTTRTDARGQTTELDQYTLWPTLSGTATTGFTATVGTSKATTYTYNAAGHQTTVTGPDNSQWAFGYDLLGRKTSQTDPDAGKTSYAYDDAGNQVSTTDARGIELDYTYDLLGRKLSGTDKSTGFEFASWAYDTLQIGQPTSSTSYAPGVSGGYTEAYTGYTSLGKPLGTKITLPASEAPLPTTYTTTYTYTANDQLLSTQTDPAAGFLSSEKIAYQRDALGNPTKTSTSTQIYVGAVTYTPYGEPQLVTYGPSDNQAYADYTYDDQTRRLTNTLITRTQAPGPTVDSTNYTYDTAGNLTSDTDAQSETGNTVTDQQCYNYDALDRLTSAWTANGSCAAAPTAGPGGDLATGAGSYWQAYSYDTIGDRLTETDYSTTTGTGTTTNFNNGCTTACNATGAQPHTLTSTTGGATPTTFTYDPDGNLATRTPTTGNGQKLTFNDEGELAEVDTVNSGGTTTAKTDYVYDASGNELIRRDPGQTTLFAGDTEIVINTSTTPVTVTGAVRTYTSGGAGTPVAIRSSLGSTQVLDYTFADLHGTATLEMDTTTQQVARQELTPYGSPRANANGTPWVDPTRGYLGKPQDTSTGYTDLGARKYDPTLGRFISDDPELETGSPQQLGGYTYAADNPTTNSDPTGLRIWDPATNMNFGSQSSMSQYYSSHQQQVEAIVIDNNRAETEYYASGAYQQYATGHSDTIWHSAVNLAGGAVASIVKMQVMTLPGGTALEGPYSSLVDSTMGSLGFDTKGTAYAVGPYALLFVPGFGEEDGAAIAEDALGCSFAPQTPVLMAHGKTKPIAAIKPGDKVESADPTTGKHQGPRTVQATHVNDDNDLVDLTIETAPGHASVLHTTVNHPFWDATLHTWVPAGKLIPGDALQSVASTAHPHVVSVHATPGSADRYNLTVQQLHTYYVLAGTTPILVHNTSVGCPIGTSSGDLFRSDTRDPNTIFTEGFKPLGSNMNLDEHVAGVSGVYTPDSGFVSTTTNETHAISRGGNVFTIRGATGGIDVNSVIPDNVLAHEYEVAFPGPIDTSCIVGCRLPGGEWLPNPNFGG